MQRLAQAGEAGEAAGTAGTGEGGVPVVVVQVGEITDLCTPSRGSSEVIPAHLSVAGAVILVPKGAGDAEGECVYGQVVAEAAARGAAGVGIYGSLAHQQPPGIPPAFAGFTPPAGTNIGVFTLSFEEAHPLLALARVRQVVLSAVISVDPALARPLLFWRDAGGEAAGGGGDGER